MTKAENIQELIDGGYNRQALRMANSESITIEEKIDGFTTFTFSDGSSIDFAQHELIER